MSLDINGEGQDGHLFYPYKCDLSSSEEIDAMFNWIKETFGRLDVTLCNAGVLGAGSLSLYVCVFVNLFNGTCCQFSRATPLHFYRQKPADWHKMMSINVIAASHCAQRSTELMSGTGDIIFMNRCFHQFGRKSCEQPSFAFSICGHIDPKNPETAFYYVTKHALTTLVEAWRREVQIIGSKGRKIRVGSICPGLVETEVLQAAMPDKPEMSKMIFDSFPSLKAQDIADLVDDMLGAPEHVQMQDLIVMHVQTDTKNMAHREGKPKSKAGTENTQM